MQAKWSCCKKLFNFEKPLPFVIASKLVLRSRGLCAPSTHIVYTIGYNRHYVFLLLLLAFKTSLRVTSCWVMFWMKPLSMSLKLKGKMNHIFLSDALIDDDDFGLIIQLNFFAKNIKKEVIGVIILSYIFWQDTKKEELHYRLALMLDPKFKKLRLIFSFIGHEHGLAIVKE